jgi:hypothetical protein
MLNKLKNAVWIIFRRGNPISRLHLYFLFQKETRSWLKTFGWEDRIRNAVECPDNKKIPRVQTAGVVKEGILTLHNGIKVGALSYDGEGPMKLMMANAGVHEPQEEFIFQEVLKTIDPGSWMLELGAYWAFYSIWFYHTVQNSRCICIEPDPQNITMGQKNFSLNFGDIPSGVFFECAYAGSTDGKAENGHPVHCVDSVISKRQLKHLAILHADTQGHELNVLMGSIKSLERKQIAWIFLSTHSNELHRKCISFLKKMDYRIVADADLLESYSYDGLIVACNKDIQIPDNLNISLRGGG